MDSAWDQDMPIHVSPITAWEIAMLMAKRRLRSTLPAERWFARLMATPGFRSVDLSADILMASWSLPGKLNSDPADRIIAATARANGLTVMTRDRQLLAYAREGYLRAVAC